MSNEHSLQSTGTEDVLLVPAYRQPGAMGTWWYAAIGSDDDSSHCTVGQALLPNGPNPGVTDWDPKYVWELMRYPGYVGFRNKKTHIMMVWGGPNMPLMGGQSGTAFESLWSLDTGPLYKYWGHSGSTGNPGFAIRPYHDTTQNINALDGFSHGHDGLVGCSIGTWGWGGGQQNETWSILRISPQNFAVGLDSQGCPDYGRQTASASA
jgi:hypothetical protein